VPEESTTPDLAARAQRFADTVSAGDIDALASFYAPRAVFVALVDRFEGRTAIGRFYEDWVGAYSDFEFDVEETRDLGDGVGFVVFAWRARLPGSRGWIDSRIAAVLTLADDLIERQRDYDDVDEARAAAERLAEERD
jgi:ketosteroid isomerase-like protein